MRTNIDINDELIQRALEMSHLKTKKAVVELALQQYIERQARQNLLSLFGKVQWDGDLEQMRTDTTPNDQDR
ncbi:type II toxin-antitoxin system VapB family antitoxin [Spirosoma pulveris]